MLEGDSLDVENWKLTLCGRSCLPIKLDLVERSWSELKRGGVEKSPWAVAMGADLLPEVMLWVWAEL